MLYAANDNMDTEYFEEMQYREFAIKVLRFQFMVARRKELLARSRTAEYNSLPS